MPEGSLLIGDKVVLRPAFWGFTPEELQMRFEWSKDRDLQYWSGNIPTAATLREFAAVVRDRDWPETGRRQSYAIVESGGSLIGMVSCYSIEWHKRTGELGVYIGDPSLWSRGYGTDAIRTLLDHLFRYLAFTCVYLNTYDSNHRALRSYAKVGFKRVGLKRRFRPSIGYYREVRMELARETFLYQEGLSNPPPQPLSRLPS